MAVRNTRLKILVILIIFIILWIFTAGKLFYLQVFQSREIGKKNREEQIRFLEIPSCRGDIMDRNGKILATDIEAYTLYAKKGKISNVRNTAALLSRYGLGEVKKLEEKLKNDSDLIQLVRGVSDTTVKNLEVPGVYALREWFRYYPGGKAGRTVIGSLNWKRKGISGIEREYNDILKGKKGWAHFLEVPMYSGIKLLKRYEEKYKDPLPGRDIVLTIDFNIQSIFEEQLNRIKEDTDADKVYGVCVDVSTGEILAMVNIPEFVPGEGWKNNGCVAWQFEPGSIFKIVPALAWIEMGFPLNDTVVDSTGATSYGGKVFKDHHPHPAFTFRDALIYSSNAGFIHVGAEVGKKKIYECARSLGIGCNTGIDLAVEYAGHLPVMERMRDIRLATVSFGQGVNTTPLQMVMAYQSIANDGILLKPRLMKEIRFKDKVVKRSKTEIVRRATEKENADTLLNILNSAVEVGTGKRADLNFMKVAGKTGTAWRCGRDGYRKGEYVSSFIGMFPYPDPDMVIGIFVDNPKNLYYASVIVCPGFKRIARRIACLNNYRDRLLYAGR